MTKKEGMKSIKVIDTNGYADSGEGIIGVFLTNEDNSLELLFKQTYSHWSPGTLDFRNLALQKAHTFVEGYLKDKNTSYHSIISQTYFRTDE